MGGGEGTENVENFELAPERSRSREWSSSQRMVIVQGRCNLTFEVQ